MDLLIRDALIIERTLCDLASFYGSNNTLRTLMAFDRERGQFLLLDEGWDVHRRVHVV